MKWRFLVLCLMWVLIVAGAVVIVHFATRDMRERGLKAVVEEIWYGEADSTEAPK